MCGIVGIVGSDAGLSKDALLSAIAHRGPDQQGSAQPAPHVWLGATRLAICDLSPAGNQPMRTDDGALTLVYNGEIYNAPALCKELAALGHVFRGHGDTEVILRGFAEWGDRVTDRLDGMFAFAIWDAPKQRLFLARDRLGIKPLWLARAGDRLVFASEVRALLRGKAVSAQISAPALESFLAWGSVAEPHSILRGIEALPPAHRMSVSRDGTHVERYWSIDSGEIDCSPKEAAAKIRERLAHSVKACLHADVPVALLLSGGIDSTALLALSRGRTAVHTFHVAVGGAAMQRSRRMAAQFGGEHREVSVDAPTFGDAIPAFLAALDQPSVDGLNTFLICRAIRAAGLKAAITGLGADEIFLGYPLYRHYLRVRKWKAVLGPMAGVLSRGAALAGEHLSGSRFFNSYKAEKFLQIVAADGGGATHASARVLFPRAIQAGLLSRDLAPPLGAVPSEESLAGELSRLELGTYLLNTLLRDADVMSMANGVELRVPMLDHHLVADVVRMSERLRLRPGRKKPLLVDAVHELPAEIEHQPKEGFELPLESLLGGANVAEVLMSSAVERVGLNRAAVQRIYDRFQARKDRPQAHRVWALYTLVQWAQAQGASA